jgi:hypothetical protein
MATDELIPAEEFCNHYKVEISFINSLRDFGLIEVTSIEHSNYITHDQLKKLEQMIRLHYDLNINLEGLDAIEHLLERVESMQNELIKLRNRLKLYEDLR